MTLESDVSQMKIDGVTYIRSNLFPSSFRVCFRQQLPPRAMLGWYPLILWFFLLPTHGNSFRKKRDSISTTLFFRGKIINFDSESSSSSGPWVLSIRTRRNLKFLLALLRFITSTSIVFLTLSSIMLCNPSYSTTGRSTRWKAPCCCRTVVVT